MKVMLTVQEGTAWRQEIVDLIFSDDGKYPLAVFEWQNAANGLPIRFVVLDQSELVEFQSGDVTHLYQVPVEEPRKD